MVSDPRGLKATVASSTSSVNVACAAGDLVIVGMGGTTTAVAVTAVTLLGGTTLTQHVSANSNGGAGTNRSWIYSGIAAPGDIIAGLTTITLTGWTNNGTSR